MAPVTSVQFTTNDLSRASTFTPVTLASLVVKLYAAANSVEQLLLLYALKV